MRQAAPPGLRLSGRFDFGGGMGLSVDGLEIRAGEITCLLGPSGVGKSTILRQIAGLETGAAFAGSLAATDGLPLPPRIAMMAQSDLLAPWLDVRGNVALGARLRGERVEAARLSRLIERVGLAPHAEKRPPALSGGMRQRVALARTLMEDRPLVLLDEPFSALDARTRAEMQELAVETLGGRTVLMVTHDPAEAARLAHAIWLVSPDGLAAVDAPPGAPPRPTDDPAVLAAGAALLARLRAAPALDRSQRRAPRPDGSSSPERQGSGR